jgi:hypothetical protein
MSEPPSFGASLFAAGAFAVSFFLASSQPAAANAMDTRTADNSSLRISHSLLASIILNTEKFFLFRSIIFSFVILRINNENAIFD